VKSAVRDMRRSHSFVPSLLVIGNGRHVVNGVHRLDPSDHVFKIYVYANVLLNVSPFQNSKDKRKKGTLFWVLNKTKTSMGARLLRSWIEQPLYDAKEINLRLDSVEELCGKLILRDKLTDILNKCTDIERIAGGISYGNFSPKDCSALSKSLLLLPENKSLLSTCNSKLVQNISNNIYHFKIKINNKILNSARIINLYIYKTLYQFIKVYKMVGLIFYNIIYIFIYTSSISKIRSSFRVTQ
jgi:DNA mismatch repair ATPase MutS